jgi:hypothetical protein
VHGSASTRQVAVLGCAFLASACEPASTAHDAAAANQPSRPTVVFPPQAELAQLPSLPAPPEAFGVDAVAVDAWRSLASPAARDDPVAYDDSSPWGGLARSIASDKGDAVRLSPALRCAAAEIARFIVERGGLPTESLRRFLVARCGATSPDATPIATTLNAPEGATDAELYQHGSGQLRGQLEKNLGAGYRAFGFGTFRNGRKFAAVGVVGSDAVRFDAIAHTVDTARRVVIRGTLRAPAADALVLINRGEYATASCERNPKPRLPEFAFSCQLGDADKAAWAQVLVRQEGRFMLDTVADLLVCDGDPAQAEYRPRVLGPAASVADAAALSSSMLGAINRVRAAGRLAPLSIAAKQSADNAQLAGTLIDATAKHKDIEADRIALGLLAGWDVDGTIRSGGLFVGLVAPTRDPMVWLDFALERPFGRNVLLDPEVRRIAIGPALPPGDVRALGAVVSTYALFESPNHEADVARVLARVKTERASRGKAPLGPIDAAPAMADQMALVLAGKREPVAALNAGMRSLAQRTFGAVYGFVAEANEVDSAPIPEPVLHAPKGALAVAVTHHRVKGAAWGQYAIFYFLVTESGASGPSVQM